MKRAAALLLAALVAASAAAIAQERGEALRRALHDDALEGAWVYDDLESGFALGRKTGRPILAVFRCVP